MFFHHLKDFTTKKIVKERLDKSDEKPSLDKIKTVGILFDETYIVKHEQLLEALASNGISREDIDVLVFRDNIKKDDAITVPFFSPRDFSWTATIKKPEVVAFINKPFDLLISYYDIEKAPLLLVSHLSKAGFKVGFASTDKRLHHFMINTPSENYGVFTDELFKYLRILNKLA